ncbi:hypothetical protein ACP70R_011414 [Stipagrostis hirtigluma subsp. patula]
MNPPPQRGPSRYGGGGGGGSAQGRPFPYVDPAEGQQAAGGVRPFFPAPEGGGEPPPPKPPSAERAQRWYGGGGADEISLGHGHGVHRYHQFGVETGNDDGGGSSGSQLPRHSGSPPGFFSSSVVDSGLRSARVGAREGDEVHRHAMSSYNKKLKSPMNLARQGTLSQIEDGISDLTENIHGAGHSEENVTASNVVHSFSKGFSIGSWEDSNSIAFTTSKTGIPNNDDIITTLSNYELQFGLTKETAGVVHMQQDQVPFRVRAKRGCATHPRSIAERERRTRISEKLRKLQALVPNMDKQTSTADMLDLAVEHIRGLHSELQTLKEEKEKCTCRVNQQSRN